MNSRIICLLPVRIAKYWGKQMYPKAIEYDKIVILSSFESAQKNWQWSKNQNVWSEINIYHL
jgi:hypothetical protein